MGTRVRALAAAGAFIWLSGCAVGPDYELPVAAIPKVFGTASLAPGVPTAPTAADFVRWWRVLRDSRLNALIERAVAANPDIEIALTRVQEAREQQIVVAGAMLPTVGGSGTVATGTGTDLTKGRVAQSIRAGDSTAGFKQIWQMAGFDAGWELDLFGKYRRELEAATEDTEAQMELRNAVLITVIGDVARNYLDVRGLQSQLEIAREDVATAQRTVDLLQTRFNRGLSNELDLTLAKRQLATQEARLPELNAAISSAESRLAVLLGTYAADVAGAIRGPGRLPRVPERLRAEVPVDLLRRRPDILYARLNASSPRRRRGSAWRRLTCSRR
jgi:NodT family efflux transporter outer membrane factor (OMF) lipoprotein